MTQRLKVGTPARLPTTSADENYDGLTVSSVSASIADSENSPPTVSTPIGNQTGTEDTPFTFNVTGNFSDADGDTLTYAATGLPEGLTINPTAGIIFCDPAAGGTSSVTVTATDTGGASVSDSFNLTVSAAPAPFPTQVPPPVQTPTDTGGAMGDQTLTGGAGGDSLTGGTGNDILSGDSGSYSVSGGDDNDLMFGGKGADTLDGGLGNDSLAGGKDDDIITGGDGTGLPAILAATP